MIRDLVVAVAVGGERDVATDHALSVAAAFDAQVSGVVGSGIALSESARRCRDF
jgi:hypothetical protein